MTFGPRPAPRRPRPGVKVVPASARAGTAVIYFPGPRGDWQPLLGWDGPHVWSRYDMERWGTVPVQEDAVALAISACLGTRTLRDVTPRRSP